jgi:hypothetical protein
MKEKTSYLMVLDYPLVAVKINFRIWESGTFPTFKTSIHPLNGQNMNTRIYRHVYLAFDGTSVLQTPRLLESLILNIMTLYSKLPNLWIWRLVDPMTLIRLIDLWMLSTTGLRRFVTSFTLYFYEPFKLISRTLGDPMAIIRSLIYGVDHLVTLGFRAIIKKVTHICKSGESWRS